MRAVRWIAALPLVGAGALVLSSLPGPAVAAARVPTRAKQPPVRITSLTLGRHVLPPTGGATVLRFQVQHGAVCWVTAPAAVKVSRVRRGCRNGKLFTVVRIAASDALHPSHYRINAFVRGLDGRVVHRTVVLGEQGLTPLRAALAATAKPVVGQGYSGRLVGTGGRAPYTWTVVGGSLPPGVTLSSSGVLAGTPTAAGGFSADVRLTDASLPTHLSLTVTLALPVAPPALGLSTPQLPQGTVGAAYTATLGATGGTPPYSWSVTSGSLPAGVTLSPTGTLSGTPTAAGTSSAVVQVTDASPTPQHATESISIVVNPSPLAVTTSILPSATAGTAYSQTLTASGGTTPYTWSVTSGTLPTGLSLATTGVLSGTPTTAGTSTVTVQVADGAGQKATANLTLTVTATPLAITTTSLPAATSGTPYFTTLAATGGTSPYTWTLTTGQLPTGLGYNSSGQIFGTTTDTTGSPYSLTFQVTDSSSPTKQTATKQFTLTVS